MATIFETITQKLPTATEEQKQQLVELEERFKQSNDFVHKENVKVYRNVQAAMVEELNKQTETIVAKQQENNKKQKALGPLSVCIILLVIIDIVMNLFNITLVF